MSGTTGLELEGQNTKTINLLPLLLQHGRTFDLPIVILNCKQIVLRDLIYKNNSGEDLIKKCKVTINGKDLSYDRSKDQSKTYYLNGKEDSEQVINIEHEKDLKVSLNVSCHDFELCHCKEHRFQLNISAICEQ